MPTSSFPFGTEFPWMFITEIGSHNYSLQELGYGIDQKSKVVFPNT